MTRKVQLRRFDLGGPFINTNLPLQNYGDFAAGEPQFLKTTRRNPPTSRSRELLQSLFLKVPLQTMGAIAGEAAQSHQELRD